MNAVSSDDILGRIRAKRAEVDRFLASAVATQLLKSNNIEQNIGRAQSARAKLEVLETSLTLGQLAPQQAVGEFLKCVEDAAFLEA